METCPSTDEWINKMFIYMQWNITSLPSRNEILIHAVVWMNLEDVMLSKINQTEKGQILYNSTCMRHLS